MQESLLDLGDEPVPGPVRPERVRLSRGAWVDVQRGWLAGSAALFARLADGVPWRAEQRQMYDRTVDVPRGPVRSSLITSGLTDRIWYW